MAQNGPYAITEFMIFGDKFVLCLSKTSLRVHHALSRQCHREASRYVVRTLVYRDNGSHYMSKKPIYKFQFEFCSDCI
jgi:hypothetical protein